MSKKQQVTGQVMTAKELGAFVSKVAKPKAVAEKATNVAKKATPKKPTIKELTNQVMSAGVTIDNLEAVLATKNTLIDSLELDLLRVIEDNKALEREIVMLNASIRHRYDVILKLETPWYKKVFNLFSE